jgi:hypothetical protein
LQVEVAADGEVIGEGGYPCPLQVEVAADGEVIGEGGYFKIFLISHNVVVLKKPRHWAGTKGS